MAALVRLLMSLAMPASEEALAAGEAALPAMEADPGVEAAVLAAKEEGRVAEAADKTYPRLWERPSVASNPRPCHHSPPLQVGPPYPAVRAAASAAHPA